MEVTYKIVYVVEDWYDGPRSGFASYQQKPHFFRSVFLDIESSDEYDPNEDRFELTPIPEKVVGWAVASHQLWLRWDEAYRAGKLLPQPHDEVRILPEDRAHYNELCMLIEQQKNGHSASSFIVCGTFDGSRGVQWDDWNKAAT